MVGILRGISSLFFPVQCCHCEEKLPDPALLCTVCNSLLLEGIGAFRPSTPSGALLSVAAVSPYSGPLTSVISAWKSGHYPNVAEAFASFLFLQWMELGWPRPDLVVPVPSPTYRSYLRGYDHVYLLARALADLLSTDCAQLLSRPLWGRKQSALRREERKRLRSSAFRLRRGEGAEDCTLLLLDDVLTTGATMRAAAGALWKAKPAAIYGFALASGAIP